MAFDAPGHHAQRQLHDSAGHLAPRRRGYLDWLRGLAVLIMIEAHLLDSWTRSPDREMPEFGVAMIVGGMGAPLFLFLAGVAVSMSAGAKFRRGGDARRASAAVVKRGFEIFGLAFLFRVQAWILGWSSPRALLKVDILNIMGPAIAAAAALWGAATTARGKYLAFAGATIAIAFLTPVIRGAAILAALPDPVEAYLRPVAGLSNFVSCRGRPSSSPAPSSDRRSTGPRPIVTNEPPTSCSGPRVRRSPASRTRSRTCETPSSILTSGRRRPRSFSCGRER
jgi:hypothetical protein